MINVVRYTRAQIELAKPEHLFVDAAVYERDVSSLRDELAALKAGQAGAVPPDDDEPLMCDYCRAECGNPWHGSGMIGGRDKHHIHACDRCRQLLPAPIHSGYVMVPIEPTRDQQELEWLEGWLRHAAEPIGQECCGRANRHECCGNSEAIYMGVEQLGDDMNRRHKELITILSAAQTAQ